MNKNYKSNSKKYQYHCPECNSIQIRKHRRYESVHSYMNCLHCGYSFNWFAGVRGLTHENTSTPKSHDLGI